MLCELDLSNDAASPFKSTIMYNDVGARGTQALALALSVNTSLITVRSRDACIMAGTEEAYNARC